LLLITLKFGMLPVLFNSYLHSVQNFIGAFPSIEPFKVITAKTCLMLSAPITVTFALR